MAVETGFLPYRQKLTVLLQMDCRIPHVSLLVRGGHGTHELPVPLVLCSAVALYSCILWFHLYDTAFRNQGTRCPSPD